MALRDASPCPNGSRRRSSSVPSQAAFLRGRGDLGQARGTFQVQLIKPSPLARPMQNAPSLSRIGIDVERAKDTDRLVVSSVDFHPSHRTPVCEWNYREERQANRGEKEQHISLAILPGDRIREVNDFGSQTVMLSELAKATDPQSPRNVSLLVSRDISNVLQPAAAPAKTLAPPPASPSTGSSPSLRRPPRPGSTSAVERSPASLAAAAAASPGGSLSGAPSPGSKAGYGHGLTAAGWRDSSPKARLAGVRGASPQARTTSWSRQSSKDQNASAATTPTIRAPSPARGLSPSQSSGFGARRSSSLRVLSTAGRTALCS